MADLPKLRVEPAPLFTYSAVDYFVSRFRQARQKSFGGCAVGKSIEKAETIIIWQSNWTETSGG